MLQSGLVLSGRSKAAQVPLQPLHADGILKLLGDFLTPPTGAPVRYEGHQGVSSQGRAQPAAKTARGSPQKGAGGHDVGMLCANRRCDPLMSSLTSGYFPREQNQWLLGAPALGT